MISFNDYENNQQNRNHQLRINQCCITVLIIVIFASSYNHHYHSFYLYHCCLASQWYNYPCVIYNAFIVNSNALIYNSVIISHYSLHYVYRRYHYFPRVEDISILFIISYYFCHQHCGIIVIFIIMLVLISLPYLLWQSFFSKNLICKF